MVKIYHYDLHSCMVFIHHLDFLEKNKLKIVSNSKKRKKSRVEKNNNFINRNNVSLSENKTAFKNTENSEINIRKKVNNGLIEDRFPCI